MTSLQVRAGAPARMRLLLLGSAAIVLVACGTTRAATLVPSSSVHPVRSSSTIRRLASTAARAGATPSHNGSHGKKPRPHPYLRRPRTLVAFGRRTFAGEGVWSPAGRRVRGMAAVYKTMLVPPGGTQPAGIAWMDTRLLAARLYSGSLSPGGGPYRYTAPIEPAQASSLVAAFNGGFYMNVAGGGYYTERRLIDPLRAGAASLDIYSNGTVNIGAWRRDVVMTRSVVSVRQNLVPLVAAGRPTAQAESTNWQAWGATCGATSCASSVPGIEHQWRSGLGITADGALLYATGPGLGPLQLAELLVRAGAVRAMQLDINPDWTVLVTYAPASPGGLAAPSNGSKLVAATVQGPWTFFEPWWARDFVTMSARRVPIR
ncbi:MAG: phosphodiester glycosidase family protein [Acidimicrobiales bacterium]